MDENLRSGLGVKEFASHSHEEVVHSVDGENVDDPIRKVKKDESNAVEETIDVQQPCGEDVDLDGVLATGKECLDGTVEGSLEELQEAKILLVNCMSLICAHRNQLESRSDLRTKIVDFASRFMYVLFRLGDYEECIRWFYMGIGTKDGLEGALESSGSVQYNVAISFLKTADVRPDRQRLQDLICRAIHHLNRTCFIQVEDFHSLLKLQNKVTLEATGIIAVTLGRLLLVPGEMFEKLLGTPYSHFTKQQVVHLLEEVLVSALVMKVKGWLAEAEVVLRMGLTFVSKIEDQEMRDRFFESIQTALGNSYESTYQIPKIHEIELRKALQSNFVESTNKNFKSAGAGTEIASTSSSSEMQQPCGDEVKLEVVLRLGQECLNRTGEGSSEELQVDKMLLIHYMSLIFEHRNQLDSRCELQTKIGDFASRFLYLLFRLEDYEECIRWYDMGIGTKDALKAALEASSSVQYNVAISFLKISVVSDDLQRVKIDEVNKCYMERGMHCLVLCCNLQVKDFDTLAFEPRSEVGVRVGTGVYATMGNVVLVPESELFHKLLGKPCNDFTDQQLEQLLNEVVVSTTEMQDKGWLVEAEAVLKMGLTFASEIDRQEMSHWFLDCVLQQLRRLYRFRGEYQMAAETFQLSNYSQKGSTFKERQLRESERAEEWSIAGDHNQAINIITAACSSVDAGDARDVSLPNEDWKLEAHLKFTYGRILERAGRTDEAIKQMEEAEALFFTFDYNGDSEELNNDLLRLLDFYGHVNIESALSLISLIDPVMSRPECKVHFKEFWRKEKGIFKYRIYDRDDAAKCWIDAELGRPDPSSDDSGSDDDIENEGNSSDKLYKKYEYKLCGKCKGKHVLDPTSHLATLCSLARCRWKNIEGALEALDAALKVVYRRKKGNPSDLVEVRMLQGALFFEHRQAEAVKAYEMAVMILREMNQKSYKIQSRLSICYGMQARVKLDEGSLDDGLDLIQKAAPVMEKENPGENHYLQAMALRLQGQVVEAAALGQMAFKELIKSEQLKPFQTHMAESAWIRTFENSTLLEVLQFNERTSYFGMRNIRDALIWAERSRTRLYMRHTEDQPSVVSSTCELFDFQYEHAEELLGDAVLMCGRETKIISYSYCNITKFLFCYLVFEGDDRNIRVHCEPVPVPSVLNQLWADRGMNEPEPTLEQLVDKAVTAIKATDPRKLRPKKDSIEDNRKRGTEKHAKNLLSILHSILLKPILTNHKYHDFVAKQLRDHCKHLVISPQGFLSKVPFGALFDEAQGEFLIQQMTVCVIPSIRTLHRCFQNQAGFEKGWKDLEHPFVAGNPTPMGARLPALPYAALEAEKVAKILDGAQLFSGEKMTKSAAVKGLSRSQVVLLSSHGIVNSSYPQGALVLKKSDTSPSSKLEETLSPADILAMPGNILAGLVVLSACESGLGTVTQAEGVLGLGRAILQKGAVTTVLTLWKVDDSATTDLITGMFENLRLGWTVPQSLQASMVKMIDDKRTLYEWAPLITMGSPKLRLPRYSSTSFEFVSTITEEIQSIETPPAHP